MKRLFSSFTIQSGAGSSAGCYHSRISMARPFERCSTNAGSKASRRVRHCASLSSHIQTSRCAGRRIARVWSGRVISRCTNLPHHLDGLQEPSRALSLSIILDDKSTPSSILRTYDQSVRNTLHMCISSVEWLAAETDRKKARWPDDTPIVGGVR